MAASAVVLALEAFQEVTCATPGGIRGKGQPNKGLGGMEPSQFGMPSSLPLVHLHHTLVAEPGRMNKVLSVLVRDRGSLTREGKLLLESLATPRSRAVE